MLNYSRQTIEADDIESVVRVLQSDFLTCGKEIDDFEAELAAYCGSKYAVVCSSGTAALHIACLALGVNKDDTVLTSPITFMASGNCARYCGAQVLFVDVDPETICLDPKQVEKVSHQKIKVLIPVHYGGGVADVVALKAIASQTGAFIIEDACHALGATYRDFEGKAYKVGSCSHSDMTVFSFHPLKQITTGEGGAITTNSEQLYKKLLTLRSHGIQRDSTQWIEKQQGFSLGQVNPWYHEMQALGFNYRLTDIQCALGRSQLKKLDRFVERRRQLSDIYRTVLKETESPCKPLFSIPNDGNAYHLFPVQIPFSKLKTTRAELMKKLFAEGIQTQVHYTPVYRQPYYQSQEKIDPVQFPHAEAYYESCLSVPLYPLMKDEDVIKVVQTLNRFL